MPFLTAKGYPYPDVDDNNNTPADIQALAEEVDLSPGIRAYTQAQIDALSAGQKWSGRIVWNVTEGEHQKWDGATWSPVGVIPDGTITIDMLAFDPATQAELDAVLGLYDEVHTTVPVPNTTVQTDLYSHSIAGGDLPGGSLFRFNAWGDQLNNSGVSQNYTYRVKLGATTILATPAFNVGSSVSRRKWTLEAWILGASAAAQRIGGRMTVSDLPGGVETMIQAQSLDFEGSNTSAEDMSAAKTLALTIQMATAGLSIDTRLLGAVLERVA